MPYDFGSKGHDARMKAPCNPAGPRREIAVYAYRNRAVGDPNAERDGGFFGRREEDFSMEIWDGMRWRLEREANAILERGEVCRPVKADGESGELKLLLLLLLLAD